MMENENKMNSWKSEEFKSQFLTGDVEAEEIIKSLNFITSSEFSFLNRIFQTFWCFHKYIFFQSILSRNRVFYVCQSWLFITKYLQFLILRYQQ